MPSFSQMKDMYRLQREAKKARKELQKIQVEAAGKHCTVTVNGEQEVVSIAVRSMPSAEELSQDLKDCLNRALQKAKLVSAEKMQGVMGELGITPKA